MSLQKCVGGDMRKSIPADAAASGASPPAGRRALELVCLALALALLALVFRIASIW
jgi:hypothetical protein